MKDPSTTKPELIKEMSVLKQRIKKLEQSGLECEITDQMTGDCAYENPDR